MQDTTPQAVQAVHEFLLWLIQRVDKFPRNRRFTLGERLGSSVRGVLELLVETAYSRDKAGALRAANLRLEMARHLWRLAHELKMVSTTIT